MRCEKCAEEHNYCEEHDARYCKSCDIWLEPVCGSSECKYCNDRPNKPSEVRD
jgi:hypothetical protein